MIDITKGSRVGAISISLLARDVFIIITLTALSSECYIARSVRSSRRLSGGVIVDSQRKTTQVYLCCLRTCHPQCVLNARLTATARMSEGDASTVND